MGVVSRFLSPSDPDQPPPTGKPAKALLQSYCPRLQRRGAGSPERPWLSDGALRMCQAQATNHRRLLLPWQQNQCNLSTGEPSPGTLSTSPICKSVSRALPKTSFQVRMQRKKGKIQSSSPGQDQFLQVPGPPPHLRRHEAPSTSVGSAVAGTGNWPLSPPCSPMCGVKAVPLSPTLHVRVPVLCPGQDKAQAVP